MGNPGLKRQYRTKALKKKELMERVENFRKERNIEVKCQSDNVKLYVNYIIDRLHVELNREMPKGFTDTIYDIYNQTRGNHMEIGILIPSSLALAIITLASQIYTQEHGKKLISQAEVAATLNHQAQFGFGSNLPILRQKLLLFLYRSKK